MESSGRFSKYAMAAGVAAVLLTAAHYRSAGLYRGLEHGTVFHPDAPKQVAALSNYLDGRYVWYMGSLFYDGYPYGLSHVDEWLIRAGRAVAGPAIRHQHPLSASPEPLLSDRLFEAALFLRVVYSSLAVLLGIWIGCRLFGSRLAGLAAGLLLALSPVPVAVAHFATGDAGPDLFGAAMLLAVAFHSRRSGRAWMAAAGFFAGLAFAAKYHGALVLGVPVLFLALEAWQRRTGWGAAAARLGLLAAGFAAGAVAATPALLIDPGRTLHFIRENFVFIRDYGASAEFLALPFAARLWHGLRVNLPEIVRSIGPLPALMTAVFTLVLAPRVLRRAERTAPDGLTPAAVRLLFAVGATALAALVLSTALKPNVQPFHFSFLQLPFCLGAAGLARLWASHPRDANRVFSVLALIAAGAWSAVVTIREHYFWRRADSLQSASVYARRAFEDEAPVRDRGPERQMIKRFTLERSRLVEFRNRPWKVLADYADRWQTLRTAPGPDIPLDDESGRIFVNGPVLPANDRLFEIPADGTVRELVYYGRPPARLVLGLRSGAFPAEVRLAVGRERQAVTLEPDEQRTVALGVRHAKILRKAGPDGLDVAIVRLEAKTASGRAWVRALATDADLANFDLTGGGAPPAPWFDDAGDNGATLRAMLEQTAFLGSRGERTHAVPGGDGLRLVPAGAPLPAGPYRLECVFEQLGTNGAVAVDIASPLVLEARTWELKAPWRASADWTLDRRVTVCELRFAKPFSPHEVDIRLRAGGGAVGVRLLSWRLEPDHERLLSDWAAFRSGGARADWMRRFATVGAPRERPLPDIRFGAHLRLMAAALPDRIRPGVPFEYGVRFDESAPPVETAKELVVFVHLVDGAGRIRGTFDFPLGAAAFGGRPLDPLVGRAAADLPPGDYRVRLGVYSVRTRLRLPVDARGPDAPESGRSTVTLGTVRVEGP